MAACEICILAGGLSRRMGRDKTRIELGSRTMLGQIRAAAKATRLPVRVIRKDCVRRCGPMGGIFTALKSTRAEGVLLLACDMPFVTPDLMEDLVKRFGQARTAVFFARGERIGFPFVLPQTALPIVEEQIRRKSFSIQALVGTLKCKTVRIPRSSAAQLMNVNTPAELKRARRIWLGGRAS